MIYLLYGLFILTCVVLIVAVLLQPGKADAGALFTSSISSTAFGPRGTQTLLAKITIVAAALFMLFSLTLALVGNTGSRSIVQPESESEQTQQQLQSVPSVPEQQNQGATPATESGNTGTTDSTVQPASSAPAAANTNSGQQ